MTCKPKSLTLECYRWVGQAETKWPKWMREYRSPRRQHKVHVFLDSLSIPNPSGELLVEKGDWIVLMPTGCIHRFDDATFRSMFEPDLPTIARA